MNLNSTDTKEIRKFGLVAFVFFGGLCLLGLWLEKFTPAYIFAAMSILGVGFILIPSRLKPIHAGWLKTARFLGRAINILILTLAYYLVITPAALIKRIVSGRPLALKPDRSASSYWIDRAEPGQPRERFLKRY